MISMESLYIDLAIVAFLAFVAGNGFGVWLALSIVRQLRRQWQRDREQAQTYQEPEFVPLSERSNVIPVPTLNNPANEQ